MASVKVKFRPSTIEGKEGTIYYQIIQSRVIRQLKTDYRIFTDEWNEAGSCIIVGSSERSNLLLSLQERMEWDLKRLDMIIRQLDNRKAGYTADDIVASFQSNTEGQSFFNFMQNIIVRLKQMGKQRTSETYQTTLKSFMQFRKDKDLLLDEITSEMIQTYEAYLQNRGISRNSSSFYMRILRAVYNQAVDKDLTSQRFPFKHVYTGVDKTVKRAIPIKYIRQIKNLDLSMKPTLNFARDMFLFSFYTRGMAFVDMAYLKKKDLTNGILTYRRHKTGQQMLIKWEKCMQEILDKYDTTGTPYLLPIIKVMNEDQRKQYGNALRLVNNKLKEIAKKICLPIPLSTYVARHSWASIAKSKNIPLSVISEGMGHDSETTTQIYLSSLDSSAINRANSLIIKDLR